MNFFQTLSLKKKLFELQTKKKKLKQKLIDYKGYTISLLKEILTIKEKMNDIEIELKQDLSEYKKEILELQYINLKKELQMKEKNMEEREENIYQLEKIYLTLLKKYNELKLETEYMINKFNYISEKNQINNSLQKLKKYLENFDESIFEKYNLLVDIKNEKINLQLLNTIKEIKQNEKLLNYKQN